MGSYHIPRPFDHNDPRGGGRAISSFSSQTFETLKSNSENCWPRAYEAQSQRLNRDERERNAMLPDSMVTATHSKVSISISGATTRCYLLAETEAGVRNGTLDGSPQTKFPRTARDTCRSGVEVLEFIWWFPKNYGYLFGEPPNKDIGVYTGVPLFWETTI